MSAQHDAPRSEHLPAVHGDDRRRGRGAFDAHGVEVDTTFTRSSLDQRSALLAGDADVAVTALDNLFAWNQPADSDFKAVAQIERATSLPVYLAAGLGSMAELAALERPRLVVDSPSSGFGIALVAIVESLGSHATGWRSLPPAVSTSALRRSPPVMVTSHCSPRSSPGQPPRPACVGRPPWRTCTRAIPGLVVVMLQRRAGEIGDAVGARISTRSPPVAAGSPTTRTPASRR